VSKLGVKKIVSNILRENGLERTIKTIPVGVFADITFFTPFRGFKVEGEIFVFDFFLKMVYKGLRRRSLKEFMLTKFFRPFSGD